MQGKKNKGKRNTYWIMSKGKETRTNNNYHKCHKMLPKKKKLLVVESLKNRKHEKLLKNGSYLENKKINSCIKSGKATLIVSYFLIYGHDAPCSN